MVTSQNTIEYLQFRFAITAIRKGNMILSRAPLRISLAGGGSDLPAYFLREGGEVFSFAINKHVYVAVHEHWYGGYRLNYSKNEQVANTHEIQHPLIRETFLELDVSKPIELGSYSDIPGSGTGMGSSSAFTVALANAILSMNNEASTPHALAALACKIEIERCGDLIGKQDQYASAFGGINHLEFLPSGDTRVNTMNKEENRYFLDSVLSLFYLGFGRKASQILNSQSALMDSKVQSRNIVTNIKLLVKPTIEAVTKHDFHSLGQLLNEGWELKKSITSGISDENIEEAVRLAKKSGGLGVKVLGAGGGGFILVSHEPGQRDSLTKKMNGMRPLDFRISMTGAEISYNGERGKK